MRILETKFASRLSSSREPSGTFERTVIGPLGRSRSARETYFRQSRLARRCYGLSAAAAGSALVSSSASSGAKSGSSGSRSGCM